MLRTLLNVVWLIFSGLWMALGYAVAGLICVIFVVTIPWAFACFRIARYALWPFGNTIVQRSDTGIASGIGNVIWLIFAGIWITIAHIAAGIAFCVTVVGIPFGLAHFKMVPISLMPLGSEIVPSATAYPRYHR
jgi:uncharacterized membrane protein YccF (DUF307 family)